MLRRPLRDVAKLFIMKCQICLQCASRALQARCMESGMVFYSSFVRRHQGPFEHAVRLD